MLQPQIFRLARPDSESNGFKPTQYDNLSDEQIVALINSAGKRQVRPHVPPPQKKVVDLDAIARGGRG
jgi:hypothetical protein